MNHPPSRAITLVCASVGLLVTLGAMICASDGLKFLQNWIAAWVLLPFAVLLLVGCLARSRGVLITATTMAVICGLGSLCYYKYIFFARPDGQGALIFLSVPFFQLALVLLALGGALIVVGRRTFRRRHQSGDQEGDK